MAIAYIHLDNNSIPSYLRKILENTINNISENVWVITDAYVEERPALKKRLDEFDKVYKHLTTGKESFEKKCFYRWFILRNFMEEENIDKIWYADSDLMVLVNLDAYQKLRKLEVSMFMGTHFNKFAVGPSLCFWTREDINKFCNFLIDTYTNNLTTLEKMYEDYQQKHENGGICDMTLLYLFKDTIKHGSLCMVDQLTQIAFLDNIQTSDGYYSGEYEIDNGETGRKIFKIFRGRAYCKNLIINKDIRMGCLHFSGGNKLFIDYIIEMLQKSVE